MVLEEITPFFRLLASESADIIKRYFRTSINVENKSDLSPVTIADKLAEEKMRDLISREFPAHGIIGEEFGGQNPEAEYVWVL
ncbi:MAG: inositol monophosphatase family protein, partial [Ignavibacteria bacterium]|nr:inositol monophosphatase family protein [Ignavibacteria bacterium]